MRCPRRGGALPKGVARRDKSGAPRRCGLMAASTSAGRLPDERCREHVSPVRARPARCTWRSPCIREAQTKPCVRHRWLQPADAVCVFPVRQVRSAGAGITGLTGLPDEACDVLLALPERGCAGTRAACARLDFRHARPRKTAVLRTWRQATGLGVESRASARRILGMRSLRLHSGVLR